MHINQAVKLNKVEQDQIALSRYENYLQFLGEIRGQRLE
jgi:putative ribosome biogenesis GTPase RsgA